MLSLASLTASAQQSARDKERLAEVKASITKRSSKEGEAQAAVAELAAIRERAEWRPTALVFRSTEWACHCGTHGVTPVGLFLLQEHTRLRDSTRLLAIRPSDQSHAALPRYHHTEPQALALCHACAPLHGHTEPLPEPSASEARAFALRFPGQYMHEWIAKRYGTGEVSVNPQPSL